MTRAAISIGCKKKKNITLLVLLFPIDSSTCNENYLFVFYILTKRTCNFTLQQTSDKDTTWLAGATTATRANQQIYPERSN